MEKYIPNMIGICDFQKRASSYLKKIKEQKREGILVSHNKPQAVLMSLQRYQELRQLEEEKNHEFEEVLQIVTKGNDEFNQGKTIKAKSMKRLLD